MGYISLDKNISDKAIFLTKDNFVNWTTYSLYSENYVLVPQQI